MYYIEKNGAVYTYDIDDRKIELVSTGYGNVTSTFKYRENIFLSDKDSGLYRIRINDDLYYRKKFALNFTGITAITFHLSDNAFSIGMSTLALLSLLLVSS